VGRYVESECVCRAHRAVERMTGQRLTERETEAAERDENGKGSANLLYSEMASSKAHLVFRGGAWFLLAISHPGPSCASRLDVSHSDSPTGQRSGYLT
jgi:hypothetical protein